MYRQTGLIRTSLKMVATSFCETGLEPATIVYISSEVRGIMATKCIRRLLVGSVEPKLGGRGDGLGEATLDVWRDDEPDTERRVSGCAKPAGVDCCGFEACLDFLF